MALVLWWPWYCGCPGTVVALVLWWPWYCGGPGTVVAVVLCLYDIFTDPLDLITLLSEPS